MGSLTIRGCNKDKKKVKERVKDLLENELGYNRIMGERVLAKEEVTIEELHSWTKISQVLMNGKSCRPCRSEVLDLCGE